MATAPFQPAFISCWIKTNTQNWLNSYFWDLIFDVSEKPEIKQKIGEEINLKPLNQWLAEKYTKIPIELKWKTTTDLYYELGFYQDFIRCAVKGLGSAKYSPNLLLNQRTILRVSSTC